MDAVRAYENKQYGVEQLKKKVNHLHMMANRVYNRYPLAVKNEDGFIEISVSSKTQTVIFDDLKAQALDRDKEYKEAIVGMFKGVQEE